MKLKYSSVVAGLMLAGGLFRPLQAEDAIFRRAFPDPIPTDADFQTVVTSQPEFVKLKYPVPIIGCKDHPEEIHVTPEGALVFPEPRIPSSLYLAPLLAVGTDQPQILDPDAVATSLVDGYKPGIQSEWRKEGLAINELAFSALLNGGEVVTGKEAELALVRYTFSNTTTKAISGSFWLNFGLGGFGQSHKLIPPAYPFALAYQGKFVTEANGDAAARVLENNLGAIQFHPAVIGTNGGSFISLNAAEATVSQPDYLVAVSRTNDEITMGTWRAIGGMDLYFEASTKHSSPGAVEIEAIATDGSRTRVGMLSKSGLSEAMPATADFVAPGEHTAKVTWSQLAASIPQGTSKLSLRPYYASPTGPAKANSWEPIFYLTQAGHSPIFKNQGDVSQNSLQVSFTLAPGETRSLEMALPYYPLTPSKAKELGKVRLAEKLAWFREYWEKELNRNTQFIIPETRLRNAYRACLAYNLILPDRDPNTGYLLIHPDATMYEHVWAGDGSVVMQTMDRLGYHKEVADYARYFVDRQGSRMPDGDVDTAKGFFPGDVGLRWLSENGFVLWALCEHYKLTGDMKWLAAHATNLIESADWVIRERARTKVLVNGEKPRHWGLLPKGRPSDLGDWDYWYFNDTYAYMGIRDAAEVLAECGHAEDAKRIAADADDYKACILNSLDRSVNRSVNPPFVPLTPYKNDKPTADYLYRYWYHLNPPIYMVEAGIFGAKDEKADWSNYWVEKLGMVSGLCKFGPEVIDPHYSYHQALSELLRGETDKFVWTFYSMYAYGQSRDTYATMEWANLRTGIKETEAWDDCRQPHMHSNSRCLAMLRIALLLEEGKKLHLMMGTPRGWLDDGKKIEIRNAPSEFGDVNYTADSHIAAGKITINIEPPKRKTAYVVVHVRPPSKYGVIKSVTVNGKNWEQFNGDSVELGDTSEKTRVVCWFK